MKIPDYHWNYYDVFTDLKEKRRICLNFEHTFYTKVQNYISAKGVLDG